MVALCFVDKATSAAVGRQKGAILDAEKSAQWSRSPLGLWAFTCCSVRSSLTNQMAEEPIHSAGKHFRVRESWPEHVQKKRSWSKEDRDWKDVFVMSALSELLFRFLSKCFFLLYLSPILLSLYCTAEPCSRLGTELTATWPEPMP